MRATFNRPELIDILAAETAKRLGKPLRPSDLIAFDEGSDELNTFEFLELEFELLFPDEQLKIEAQQKSSPPGAAL